MVKTAFPLTNLQLGLLSPEQSLAHSYKYRFELIFEDLLIRSRPLIFKPAVLLQAINGAKEAVIRGVAA